MKLITKEILVASVILLLVLSGCDIVSDPKLPTWDVEFNLPFVNRTYTLKEIIERDTTNLKLRGDTALIVYEQQQDLNPIRIENRMTMVAPSQSISTTVGSITIDAINPIAQDIRMTSWAPVTPGQAQVVPPINNKPVSQPLDRIKSFEVAELSAGSASVKFRNENGPFQMIISNIVLKSAQAHTYLNRTIPQNSTILSDNSTITLDQNQERTVVFPLAGVTIVDSLVLEFNVSTPGSGGSSVMIPANPVTKVNASFSGIVLKGMKGVVPRQNPITQSKTVSVDDSTYYSHINFDSGSMSFTVNNSIDVPLLITLSIPEMTKPDGSNFLEHISVPAKGNTNLNIPNLKNYSLNSTGGLKNSITYTASAENIVQPGVKSTILTTDSIVSNITMSNLVIESITGKVKPAILRVVETDIGINLRDLQGNFRYGTLDLKNSQVSFHVGKATTFDVIFGGRLKGTNGVNNAELPVPPTVIGAGVSEIKLNPNDVENFILAFPNNLPHTLTAVGESRLNPTYKEGTAKMIDSVYGYATLEFPTYVGISNGRYSDTVDVDFSSSDSSDLENANYAEITMIIDNSIASSLQFSGTFLDKNYRPMMNLIPNNPGNDSTILVHGGTVGADDRVIAPARDSIVIKLVNQDFKNFQKSKYLLVTFRLNTSKPGGAPVKFYANDKVSIRVYGKFSYKVDLNEK